MNNEEYLNNFESIESLKYLRSKLMMVDITLENEEEFKIQCFNIKNLIESFINQLVILTLILNNFFFNYKIR